MYKLLRLPLILGTLMTFVLGFVLFDVVKLPKTAGNTFLIWGVMTGAIFLLNLLAKLKEKSHAYGEKLGTRLAGGSATSANHAPAEPKKDPTFFQEACDLPFVGEYIALFFAALPLIIVVSLYNTSAAHKALEIWETIVISILTFFWLLYLEAIGEIRLTTPHLPIPLKWLVFPLAIWMLVIQIQGV